MGWRSGNVEMHIWPLEHCLDPIDRWNYGPHVTAVCRPENWTARIAFSMHYDHVYLYDLKPVHVRPRRTSLQRLLNEVRAKRSACRVEWWKNMRTACLDNASVVKLGDGTVEIRDSRNPQIGIDGRIMSNSDVYVAGVGVYIDVKWFGKNTTKELLQEV